MKYFLSLLILFSTFSNCFCQEWERLGLYDNYDPGEYGYYETINEYSQKNCPGFKEAALKWTTSKSVYVLESIGSYEIFTGELDEVRVMLWEYSIDLEQWRVIQDKLASDYNLGEKGVPDENNFPGYRTSSPTWVDHDDNLWLFTGQGNYEPNTYIDLWKFDTETHLWTFMNGAISENGIIGNHGEIGVPSSTALPNARPSGLNSSAISFVDRNGDLVLFRGSGSNDLWRYQVATNQWELLIGEDPELDITFYNYESPSAMAFDRGVFWTDDDNNYFFLDEMRTRPAWRIWKFDTQTLAWNIELEDNTTRLDLTTFREENAETIITSTNGYLTWNQDNEYMWFFGGDLINIMYRLNLKTYQWAWFNGTTRVDGEEEEFDETIISRGFAYRKGEERSINLPPGRGGGANWMKDGKLYLGYGSTREGPTYDIWSYNLSNYNFTLEKGSSSLYYLYASRNYQNSRVDTTLYRPRPYDDSYNVGTIKHGDFVYQFDDSRNFYRRNMKTGINELLRERIDDNVGTIGVASQEVYPYYMQMLGVYENEIYAYTSAFKDRMFKYNIETNLFTCIKEVENESNGDLGEFNDTNMPGFINSRYASWISQDGFIYLFRGGVFWKYDITTNQWGYVSVFEPDRSLIPRFNVGSSFNWWLDDEGDLWWFNYSMWKYDTSENTWELIKHGLPEPNTASSGNQSEFSIFNNPSARFKFINWKDEEGRFWMAHGKAIRENSVSTINSSNVFNDIWIFDPVIKNWVWLTGPTEPINRRLDAFFTPYDREEPYTNVDPPSTSEDYLFHNTYTYNEGSEITVIENCDGTVWTMDYSSLVPDYNTLSGTALYDLENDGCDTLDKPFTNLQVIVDDYSAFTFTDSFGKYAQFCNETACDFTAKINTLEEYFTVTPAEQTIDFGGYGHTENLDFCVSPAGEFNDMEAIMIPLDEPTFGFESDYELIFRNKGTTTLSGFMKLYYNRTEVNIQSFDQDTIGPAHYNTVGDTIQWEFTNLEPFESIIFDVSFRISPAMAGDSIHYEAEACLSDSLVDFMPSDNLFDLSQVVVSSLDPNDKTLLEGDLLPVEQIDDYVHYRIRFENTGTAAARFIYLEDFIDTDIFDISTLRPVSASHRYVSRVEEGNKLFVLFEDIFLPFDPEDGNTGYFLFKIKIKEDVQVTDELRNTAKIYFDYNEPITTEESVATFEILDQDGDGFIGGIDCDDTDPNINPDQTEIPYNGIDDDCNALTLDDDLDEDGYILAEDCDDTNAEINAGLSEVPYNGIDDDCNALTLDNDLDEDGYALAEDCDDSNSDINPGLSEVPYNGIDDDCDALTLDDDLDEDGYILAEDCDDTNAGINPEAIEIPNNGIDEDCDGGDLLSSIYQLANSTLLVYPNPANDIINIEVEGNLDFTATLFDLEGKKIKTYTNPTSIKVEELPVGIYLISIEDQKTREMVSERIVIER